MLKVYIKDEDKVVEMSKGQYLREVVSAEMPASFESEALKAQAVAARSYLTARMNAYATGGKPQEHKGADICTDFAHCKAWISEEKRKELWGTDADKNWAKISAAVSDTAEQVIYFGDEVISAVFHSTSSGRTENSKDVWGGERAYLVSVESPGEENAPNFKSEKTLSLDEFKRIASENIEGADLESEIIGEITRSQAGGIISLNIGGQAVKGTLFRTMYDLKSTNVNITVTDSDVHFDVTGYGHGVGMSQYGANAMARRGADYIEILTHYYQGTQVR
ncbi:MAG: stage II sporulation protein D [Clostridia bacterium]|nr:stage II sporulation protein D [Clostridia bacterium]